MYGPVVKEIFFQTRFENTTGVSPRKGWTPLPLRLSPTVVYRPFL